MTDLELAKMLFGEDRHSPDSASVGSTAVPGRTRTYTALALENSDGGYVLVQAGGTVISPTGDSSIKLPTQAIIREGDVVNVTVVNGIPMVTGAVGWGDRVGDAIVAQNAQIETLQATTATIDNLNAATAKIENLETGFTQIDELLAETANVANANVENLAASNARIQNLEASTADIDEIRANSAKVRNLTAAQLEADHAAIEDLDANYARINLANVNNAWIANGVIKDAAITDAKILGVSANKLTAGTIDASKINVANLRTDSLIVNTINGQPVIGGFSAVDSSIPSYINANPSGNQWYEIANGAFVRTADTVVNPDKAYYIAGTAVPLYSKDYIDSTVEDLNARIDSQIETFTSSELPTLLNYPANGWAPEDYKDHVGDLCYVMNPASEHDGFAYRFALIGNTYEWALIKDNQVTAALGRIDSLEEFETSTSAWRTETDEELSDLRTRHTRVADWIGNALDTTTFNEVRQTVDGNSQRITQFTETVEGLKTVDLPAEPVSATGREVICRNAATAPLVGLSIKGRSVQNGTPTKENPVPIVGISGYVDGKIVICIGDPTGEYTQTFVDIDNREIHGLPNGVCDAIHIDSNGNVHIEAHVRSTIGATSEGLSLELGVDSLSEDGTLDDGTIVMHELDEVQEYQISFIPEGMPTVEDGDRVWVLASAPIDATVSWAAKAAIGSAVVTNTNAYNNLSQSVEETSSVVGNITQTLGVNGDGTSEETFVTQTQLTQTSQSIEARFTNYYQIEEIDDALDNKADASELQRFVGRDEAWVGWFNVGQLENEIALQLGVSGTEFNAKLTNTRLVFMQGSTALATLSGTEGLSADTITVDREFHIGPWFLTPRHNNNLTLKWIG